MDIIEIFWAMLCEMAPYLLLGFGIAGVMHAFVPASLYRTHLAPNTFGSVVKAALFGIPLPLCSCGVVPTAMGLQREGASRGATVSFLIATPQTGVDSIAATYSMMGLPFALLRPVAALVTAVGGGALANRFARRNGAATAVQEPEGNPDTRPAGFAARVRAAAVYGFGRMMEDIGRWLLIGLVLAALITAFVPADFLASLSDYPMLSMLLVLALSVPMYVCATGSIPIAVALMLKGLSPGAALVLLMAGPATNAASLMVVHKALGRGVQLFYVGAIVVGAMLFGLLADYFMPASWFELPMAETLSCPHHSGAGTGMHNSWVQLASGIVLSILLLRAIAVRTGLIRKHSGDACHCCKDTEHKDINAMKEYKIEGMMCNHCRANVEKTIAALPGVEKVTVDLAAGRAQVEGNAAPEAVIAAVAAAGYDCSEA
ncbi:MAG: permease [Muribaculaceae bacterium]|nr:permease [Muribaculaceae bacterium]